MWLTFALVIVLSVFDRSFAQAPDDADPFCTVDLPGIGFNILDYAPEVKPLMDSRHYQNLLPPHPNPVWQEVDNDDNNPSSLTTDWTQNSNLRCRQTAFVCGFTAGNQDNWMITQHISRMVGGTALPQVTVQVDFQLISCTQLNNCGRTFAIHKYETSTINATAARNLSNYEFVPPRITPTDGSGDVRENSSVQIDFSTGATGLYLGIRDETSCVVVHRVLVFYYVCPAETSDLITRPEVIAPRIGNSAPIVVNGQCVENSSPENGIGARLTCSQNGVWAGLDGAGCVCDTGFQRSLDGRSCVVAPEPLQVNFIGGSPVVEGSSVRVEVVASQSTAGIMCELLNRQQLESPLVANCSNGSVTFTGIAPGRYRLRVVASAPGSNRTVLRRRVVIPEGSNFCTANLIDEGAVVNGSNVTVYFRGVGPVTQFLCSLDRQRRFTCTPPVGFSALGQGEHRFKAVPLGCGRRYTALPLRFTV